MATIKELKELALHSVRGTAPANYTTETVDEALRGELAAMCNSVNNFMRNRYDIYDIIIETADEIVPKKVIDIMGIFAEIKSVPQGQKAIFKRGNVGRNRAKKFLTQVGLSGLYETFRLDNETFELGGKAIGGAAAIDFERFLDGAENMADLMDIITEGLTDAAFGEVQKCLIAAAEAVGRPDANKVIVDAFDGDAMFKLVSTVKAYGGSAVIFAAPEFVGAMGPDAIVPVSVAGNQAVYHPGDIDAIHNNGYINIFRGTPVVQIPQSFVDEKNEKTWINPQFAYVLPAGKEKVVKVVFEGNTQVWDLKNPDNSMEIHTYKKMGAAILTHHNWGVYQNKAVADTSDFPYGV
jgi:hypothetical protein